MTERPTSILIVDDSALYRQAIQNVLREIPNVSVVGAAKDGREALEKIQALDPDLLTLDVEMPNLDGMEVLQAIGRQRLRCKAIMVSKMTSEGAQVTTDALLTGAFDFILKPSGGDWAANRQRLFDSLEEKISAFQQSLRNTTDLDGPSAIGISDSDSVPVAQSACRAVLLGASTGGPVAYKIVLPRLPADLGVPVLLVQHMPPRYTNSLAQRLNAMCPLEVLEAADGAEIRAGQVLVAPGGQQMKVDQRGAAYYIAVTDDPPENGCRPSVDYLFRSAATAFDGAVLGVVMTGMGRDGCQGSQFVKESGGHIFAQHQDDCVVYGMPKAVITARLADRVLPLGKMAAAITRHIKRSRKG